MNELDFYFDQAWKDRPGVGGKYVFPGSRAKLLKLAEQPDTYESYGDAISCAFMKWEFQCPLDWDALEEIGKEGVRYCDQCEQNVHTAYTRKDLTRLSEQGECVRLITKYRNDVMGMIADPFYDMDITEQSFLLLDAMWDACGQYRIAGEFKPVKEVQRLNQRINAMITRFKEQVAAGIRSPETFLAPECDLKKLSDEQKQRLTLIDGLLYQDEFIGR